MAVSTEIILRSLTHSSIPKRENNFSWLAESFNFIESGIGDLIQQTVTLTVDSFEITSALPGFELNALDVHEKRMQVQQQLTKWIKLDKAYDMQFMFLLKMLNKLMVTAGIGNCFEHATFLFEKLRRNDIDVEIIRAKSVTRLDSHVFLVINRATSSAIERIASWNDTAVIVDPYLQIAYPAKLYEKYLTLCQYDPEAGRVKYIPFNPDIHNLDGSALDDYLEDTFTLTRALHAKREDRASKERVEQPDAMIGEEELVPAKSSIFKF